MRRRNATNPPASMHGKAPTEYASFVLDKLFDMEPEVLADAFGFAPYREVQNVKLHYPIKDDKLEDGFTSVLKVMRALDHSNLTHLTLCNMPQFISNNRGYGLFAALKSEKITYLRLSNMNLAFIKGAYIPCISAAQTPSLKYVNLVGNSLGYSDPHLLREFFAGFKRSTVIEIDLQKNELVRLKDGLVEALSGLIGSSVKRLYMRVEDLSALSQDALAKLLQMFEKNNIEVTLFNASVDPLPENTDAQQTKKNLEHAKHFTNFMQQLLDSKVVDFGRNRTVIVERQKKGLNEILFMEGIALVHEINSIPRINVAGLYSYAPTNQAYKDVLSKYANTISDEKIQEARAKFSSISADAGEIYTVAQAQIAKLQKPEEASVPQRKATP